MLGFPKLKQQAKKLFRNKYWPAVWAGFLLVIASCDSFLFSSSYLHTDDPNMGLPAPSELLRTVTSSQFFYSMTFTLFVTFFFSVFIGNPIAYGARSYFRHLKDGKTENKLYSGFQKKNWLRVSALLLWKDLICFVWGLLLIVPGIMKSYEYKFVPYILEEHPMMSSADVLKYSSNLTKGHKMELFKLDLSFIGWFLIQVVTFDLAGIFYAGPYFYTTQALAYIEISEAAAKQRRADADRNYKKNRSSRKKENA